MSNPETTTISPKRRRLFRAAFILAAPAALVLFELFLRLTGIGLPSAFELKNMNATGLPLFDCRPEGAGRECSTSRFFNGYIAPQQFRLPKPAGVTRVFVLGESVAAGYPYNLPGSFSKFMEVMLAETGARYEFINVAVPGIRGGDIRRIAIEVTQYQPDWLILYLGNNVFLDLNPAAETGPLGSFRHLLRRHLQGLRLYPFFVALRIRLAGDQEDREPDFVRESIATRQKILSRPWSRRATDVMLERFRRDLSDIAGLARDHGARVLIATVPVNLRDFHPFPERDFARADRCLAPPPGDTTEISPAAASERDACAGKSWPAVETMTAPVAYRAGCCALWGRDRPAAQKLFVLAVERDRMKLRATPEVNDIIRGTASALGLTLADVEEAFAAAAAGGIPGDDLFLDQVHPDLPGEIIIARVMIEALAGAGQLRLDDPLRRRMNEAADRHLRRIPLAYRAASLATLAGRIANSGFFTRSLRLYRRALELEPDNPDLHAAIGNLERLVAAGSPPETPASPD